MSPMPDALDGGPCRLAARHLRGVARLDDVPEGFGRAALLASKVEMSCQLVVR